MKTKTQPRPRKMWANYYHQQAVTLHASRFAAEGFAACFGLERCAVRVAVIPLNDPAELVNRAATAIAKERGYGAPYAPKFFLAASAALAAIGVLPKSRAKKGGAA